MVFSSQNTKTIATVAVDVLEKNNKPLSLDELHTIILTEELYKFKIGADSRAILNKELKKKCINQYHSNKGKITLFFFDYKISKYGLLAWITQEIQDKYIQEAKNLNINLEKNSSEETKKKDQEEIATYANDISGLQVLSLISALWFIFVLVFFFNDGGTKLSLNAMGDYLAGFFAPLLFIWLVYGVFLQKEEFGKVVQSFELQQKEFTDSVQTMKDQVVQVEVQHLNTWFNRNIRMIETIKVTLINNIFDKKVDSIALINKNIKNDISCHKDYFNVFDELRSILMVFLYMEEYLENIIEKESSNAILINSAKELKEEFDMLMEEDMDNAKEIISIVYLLIECRSDIEYKDYEIYSHWIRDRRDIMNLLASKDQGNLLSTLLFIVQDINKLSRQLDFKKGKIYGSI